MRGYNVTGWSPLQGACGVTGHIVAIGTMASAYYDTEVTMASNHLSNKMLENYLSMLNRGKRRTEEKPFYSGPDYPDWVGRRSFYERSCDKEWFKGKKRIEVGRKLFLGKPVMSCDDDPFPEYSLKGITIIDSSGNNSLYTFRTLEEADLIVVFLPCDKQIIMDFLSDFKELKTRMIIAINRFTPYALCNQKDIMAEAPPNVVSVMTISYSKDFELACVQGCIDEIIHKHVGRRSTSNYFKQIKALTSCMLENLK